MQTIGFRQACQKCVLRVRRNFFKNTISLNICRYVNCFWVKANIFGRLVKTASYVPTGTFCVEFPYLTNFKPLLLFSHFRQNFFENFTDKIGRVVKASFFVYFGTFWGKSDLFERVIKNTLLLDSAQKTLVRGVIPSF